MAQITTDTSGLTSATGFIFTDMMMKDKKYGTELTNIYNLWQAGKESEALNAYWSSKWFTENGPTVTQRYQLALNQPGAYNQALESYKSTQKVRLTQLGVNVNDPSIDEWLKQSYDGGLNDAQVNSLIAKSAKAGTTFGGDTLTATESLKQYADSFGLSYDPSKPTQWGNDLFTGKTTEADIKLAIQTEAASAYPAYADQIMKGTSVNAIASSYKASMASLLEIDADSIGYNDPKLRAALQYVDPVTGKAAVLPLWQWEKQVRSDARWQYTNNARDTVDALQYKVMKDWALI